MAAGIKQRHPVSLAYAQALIEVGIAREESELYGEQLDSIVEAIERDDQFAVFLESPKIRREEKKAVLEKALAGVVSDPVLNLVRILIDRDRQEAIGDIARTYSERLDMEAGRVTAKITSAVALGDEIRETLVGALSKKLQKEVIAEDQVDSDLLGGLTIQVGDMVLDSSLRSHLRRVRQDVAQLRLGKDLIDED